MTTLQKIIIAVSLGIIMLLQHLPVKAYQDNHDMLVRRVDSYMACMAGRVAISAFADYSDKGMDAAVKYAKAECSYVDAILSELNDKDRSNIATQLIDIWKATQAGMIANKVNAENNAEAFKPSDDSEDHSPTRGLIMARKHYLETFVRL